MLIEAQKRTATVVAICCAAMATASIALAQAQPAPAPKAQPATPGGLTAAQPATPGAEEGRPLVELLLDSLEHAPDPKVEDAWRVEIRRRVTAYERGEAVLYDADEVIAEAKRLAP